MTEAIGRNEPCPCGSGKKYKKCCGVREAVSITHVIESEIDDLQKKLLHFALNYYENEIFDGFEEYQDYFDIEEDERQFYEFVYTIWFSLFNTLEDGETILEHFITAEVGKIKRPKLKQILQSWTEARTIAGEIVSVEDNSLIVADGFTAEKYEVILINKQKAFEAGSFFIGILLPFDQKYVFFPAPFDLPELPVNQAKDFIETKSRDAGYHSPQEFLIEYFMEIMKDLTRIGGMVDIDSMEWQKPVYKEVAELLKRKLESLDEMPSTVDIGIILWFKFCEKKQKNIRKPNLYAASMHYLLTLFNHMVSPLTQKETAKLYDVAVGSLSTTYAELDDILEEDIRSIIDMSYEEENEKPLMTMPVKSLQGPMPTEQAMQEVLAEIQDGNFETIDEINEFLKKKLLNPAPIKEPKTNKERAQRLIYDAMEVQGAKRYKLAEEALSIDPNCVDAYVILAENASTPEEAMVLSKKGMEIGQKVLGKAFFKENGGHFWGMLETRPYMRAKANYAETLYELELEVVAIKEYEELLELNPTDNQGIRYRLFPIYLETGNLVKAEKLLTQYEETTAHGLYNTLLLDLYKNGFSSKAVKLLKDAKKENIYVVSYLTGKKQIPMYLPDHYGWGDENEAIIYVDEHLPLWEKIEGLQEWLKKH
ncbi:SEC-C metal-binding domain-containing protein [Neobacillus niacini]|uniref:SEC-C metal-binding domain-containing protein n=1 Tax=Neobacillus niacini TaxID=86668 RepID=UPI002041D28F|nr:SEC-C metal-binding domain-containing protein [Neobacillus niacini]MCM3691746.1 SEC-C metal-binding domain-containing protein [Neobacillus niacini]